MANPVSLPLPQPVTHNTCQRIKALVTGIIPSCSMEPPFPTASDSNCCPSTAPKQLPLSATVEHGTNPSFHHFSVCLGLNTIRSQTLDKQLTKVLINISKLMLTARFSQHPLSPYLLQGSPGWYTLPFTPNFSSPRTRLSFPLPSFSGSYVTQPF